LFELLDGMQNFLKKGRSSVIKCLTKNTKHGMQTRTGAVQRDDNFATRCKSQLEIKKYSSKIRCEVNSSGA